MILQKTQDRATYNSHMETLNGHQRAQLIELKNDLMEKSNLAYQMASIEEDKTKEAVLMQESKVQEKISKIIEAIIYKQPYIL